MLWERVVQRGHHSAIAVGGSYGVIEKQRL